VADAVGRTLYHDHTIIAGGKKGVAFKRGHVLRGEDISVLLNMGKENVYVWEPEAGMLHEDDAAVRLAALCAGSHMTETAVSEGKIELVAGCDGLFRADTAALAAMNAIPEIAVAFRRSLSPVRSGDRLAAMRVIPLEVPESVLAKAAGLTASPVFEVLPWRLKTAALIVTGSEVLHGRVTDAFTPTAAAKFADYGITITRHTVIGDDASAIAEAIAEAHRGGCGIIACAGGMSVDPDDQTPGAIRRSGAQVVTYGTPVFPGAMFMLAYFADGTPVVGLPGCVMHDRVTVFDVVLPRIAAGIGLTGEDFAGMGNGGLCLKCRYCCFPACSFGTGG
jgi:molybdopterin biosynthesis enzyme